MLVVCLRWFTFELTSDQDRVTGQFVGPGLGVGLRLVACLAHQQHGVKRLVAVPLGHPGYPTRPARLTPNLKVGSRSHHGREDSIPHASACGPGDADCAYVSDFHTISGGVVRRTWWAVLRFRCVTVTRGVA